MWFGRRHLQLLLQETHAVVDCSVNDTVAVDPNGCCEVLHGNGTNFGIAVCSLGKELLVKAVAVPHKTLTSLTSLTSLT